MATVESRTRISIDELVNGTVVGGSIVNGQLVLATRGGAQILAGAVTKPFGEVWSYGTAYTTGDVVGYGGGIYKARGDNIGMCPPLFTTMWTCLIPPGTDEWYETDPDFQGNDLSVWEFFWQNGGASRSLSQTAGDFETGSKSLKVNLPNNSQQRIYQKAENLVRGGDVVQILTRIKTDVLAAEANLNCELFVGSYNSEPAPFQPATTTVGSLEGAKLLVPSWQTLRHTFVVPNNKQRARVHLNVGSPSANVSALIDHYEVRRYASIYRTPSDWYPFPFAGGWGQYGGWDACRYRRTADGMVKIEGLCLNTGTAGILVGTLPQYFRPGGVGKHVPCAVNGQAGYVNIFPDGRFVLNTPSNIPTNGWVSLEVAPYLAEN